LGSAQGAKPEAAGQIPAAHDRVEALNRTVRQAENARISGEMRVKMLTIDTIKCPCPEPAQGQILFINPAIDFTSARR
jgi:hypothetical protein